MSVEPNACGSLGPGSIGVTREAPRSVHRVNYQWTFVLDEDAALLGGYALSNECPFEWSDLRRALPLSGMRHWISFFMGEYAFTPFRVDDLWFVVLSLGVPQIEERAFIGSLLAATRLHLLAHMAPALARREAILNEGERDLREQETQLDRRALRLDSIDADEARAPRAEEGTRAAGRRRVR